MTNIVKIQQKTDYVRDSVTERVSPLKSYQIETTSELLLDNTQIVGTTHEVLAIADITDDALAIIENLSPTATIEIGGDAAAVFVPWIRIPPGYPAAVLPVVESLAATYLISSAVTTPIRVRLYKIVAPV